MHERETSRHVQDTGAPHSHQSALMTAGITEYAGRLVLQAADSTLGLTQANVDEAQPLRVCLDFWGNVHSVSNVPTSRDQHEVHFLPQMIELKMSKPYFRGCGYPSVLCGKCAFTGDVQIKDFIFRW